DLHRLRHLAARRAVQLVLSGDGRDIEHFTAPAVLAAIGYAARKPLSDLPAEELADIARALVAGAEDALRPDDVYDICNYYRPVQRDILHATSGDAALIGEAFGDNRPVTLAQAMHAFADHV